MRTCTQLLNAHLMRVAFKQTEQSSLAGLLSTLCHTSPSQSNKLLYCTCRTEVAVGHSVVPTVVCQCGNTLGTGYKFCMQLTNHFYLRLEQLMDMLHHSTWQKAFHQKGTGMLSSVTPPR